MPSLTARLTRKKIISFDKEVLPRVLSLVDLTLLGIGSTVGIGFYILAGQVARNVAGPAVTISFLIAGIASVFAGLCYAEFGSRVPKAGSAYIYSYVCVGEFTAFVIGWNLVLEYVIGTASVARGFSAYINVLTNGSISTALDNAMHMGNGSTPNYPDFLAFSIVILLTVVLCVGVKESTYMNNVFTSINLFVIVYAIIACSTKADPDNWKLTEDQVDIYSNDTICLDPKVIQFNELEENPWGVGGFVPYGFNGIMQGAATCFFGFVGFDVIATTGEEAMNPGRNIPLAIIISLAFVFASYFGLSVVLTMALPYCMQDPEAPLIKLFDYFEMIPSKWIVSTGAIFGFSASLFGVMFPMPRILYAMADDGLIFRFMSRINKKFKTPIAATCISSGLAAIMALMFTLDSLVNMMSIGTLMAYTIVAICVMLLRFTNIHVESNAAEYVLLRYSPDISSEKDTKDSSLYRNYNGKTAANNASVHDYLRQIFTSTNSSDNSICVGEYLTLSYSIVSLVLALLVKIFGKGLVNGDPLALSLVSIFAILSIVNLVLLGRQPQSNCNLHFKVPLVPWLPGLSTFINLYLMCSLPIETWIRFAIWMVIGLVLYFFYGMKHSVEEINGTSMLHGDLSDHVSRRSLHIPHILVHPPTPSSSLKVIKLSSKRVSILDNDIIIDDLPNPKQSNEIINGLRENLSDQNEKSIHKSTEFNQNFTKSWITAGQLNNENVYNNKDSNSFIFKTSGVMVPYTNTDISDKNESANKLAKNLFLNYNSTERKLSTHSGHSNSEPSTPKIPRKKVLKRGRSFDVLSVDSVSGSPQRYIVTPIYYDDKSFSNCSRKASEISLTSELHRKLFALTT